MIQNARYVVILDDASGDTYAVYLQDLSVSSGPRDTAFDTPSLIHCDTYDIPRDTNSDTQYDICSIRSDTDITL